ncbi:MAG: hypothetical protein ABI954_02000 [Pyrinomonadaceae bacterium]
MKRLSAKLHYKTVSQFTALFLCFWMSGVMCAVTCCPSEMTVLAEKPQEASEAVQANACPMHKQAAEQRSEGNSGANSQSLIPQNQNAPRFECCALASFFSNAAQKNRQADAPVFASIAPLKVNVFIAFRGREAPLQRHYKIVPQTRGDTYLRNCVFLI